MNAQFKKGVLELCVLAVLMRKECYGFELVNRVSKSIAMSEGTIYPLLKRLKDDGLLTTYLAESTEGPPRKYYKLTREGVGHYEKLFSEWKEFACGVERILKGDGEV